MTYAGIGEPGPAADNQSAIASNLSFPGGILIDSDGNLVFADTGNHRVRKVDARTGVITTIAGTGQSGFSGDSDQATRARLNSPRGVASDREGNLFIADTGNSRIRRVDKSTQMITTVGGNGNAAFAGDEGPATSAALNFPLGLAIDGAGDIFVLDSFNHRVRKITASGTITTVGGSGQPGFSGDGGNAINASIFAPSAIQIDRFGNLFFADTVNERIRAIRGIAAPPR
jgi:hypothetical protein